MGYTATYTKDEMTELCSKACASKRPPSSEISLSCKLEGIGNIRNHVIKKHVALNLQYLKGNKLHKYDSLEGLQALIDAQHFSNGLSTGVVNSASSDTKESWNRLINSDRSI